MEIQLKSPQSGADAGSLTVADEAFAADYNEALIHQVVTAYLAGARAGTKAQKTRADVKATTAKPWRQKGTGRARAGSVGSPIWRGGGATFAARPRSYDQKVNKKMYRGALRSIWSELSRQDRLIAVDELTIAEPRTKLMSAALSALDVQSALIVVTGADANIYLAARNIPNVDVVDVSEVNPVDLIRFDKVVITRAALEQVGERLA